MKSFSHVRLFATPWTAAYQAPPSLGFSHLPAAAAKLLQSCPTLCDPIDSVGPHQAPLSLGFSRQEHWNGLPFPSPIFLDSPKYTTSFLFSYQLKVNRAKPSLSWDSHQVTGARFFWTLDPLQEDPPHHHFGHQCPLTCQSDPGGLDTRPLPPRMDGKGKWQDQCLIYPSLCREPHNSQVLCNIHKLNWQGTSYLTCY